MRSPSVHVPFHALVPVIAVNPQERHRLRPSRRNDLGTRTQQPHDVRAPGTKHVAKEGHAVLWTVPRVLALEHGVGLNGIDGKTRAAARSEGEGRGGTPPVASNLHDASPGCLGRQVPQQPAFLLAQVPFREEDATHVRRQTRRKTRRPTSQHAPQPGQGKSHEPLPGLSGVSSITALSLSSRTYAEIASPRRACLRKSRIFSCTSSYSAGPPSSFAIFRIR